jgi:hypothetical protein
MGHALKIYIYVNTLFIIFIGHLDRLTRDIYRTKAKITGVLPVSDGPPESLILNLQFYYCSTTFPVGVNQ